MNTIFLLVMSNVFMTFAWYGHLKYGHGWPLWKAILVSWAIALLEYCLAVPANRLGYGEFSGFQLKIIRESRHADGLHRVRDDVPEGETGVELSDRVRVSRSGRVLCLCVQGSRTGCLNDGTDAREDVHHANDPKNSESERAPSKPANAKPPDIASASAPDTLAVLHVNPDTGLTSAEVDTRRKEHGYNEVVETKEHPVRRFLSKFWGCRRGCSN